MALEKLVFAIYCIMSCQSLLTQHQPMYSNDEVFNMMKQMNKTISKMETTITHMENTISHQNKMIADLTDAKNTTNIGFHAKLTYQISNLGDNQDIHFDHVLTNVGNSYDPRHGHFTAPVSGLYLISASVMSYPSHYIHCEIVKNGKVLSRLYGGGEDSQGDTQTFVVDLQAGDMVWVRHTTGASNEVLNSYNSYFSGFFIST